MELTDIIGWCCMTLYFFGAVATAWWCEKRLRLHGKVNSAESVFIITTGIFWIISLPLLGILKMMKKKQ